MPADAAAARKPGPHRDRIAGIAIALLGAYVAIAARTYPFGTVAEPGPGFVPFALGVLLAALGLVIALGARSGGAVQAPSFRDPHVFVILGVLAIAALAMERVGFRLTVAAMLLFLLGVVERRPLWAVLAVAFVVAFGAFYLVNDVLRVPLPLGPWGL
jgi:Tripartite tricarboxylate transporter TctB family